MTVEETELVILGAGVPAVMMAAEASRRGLKARLLHGTTSLMRPWRNVFLQPQALVNLSRLELLDSVRLAAAEIDRIRLFRPRAVAPAVALDYRDAGLPNPFALALPWHQFERVVVDALDRCNSIVREPEVALTGLLTERDRVRGVTARSPEGDLTYRSWATLITTDLEYVLGRAGFTPRRPGLSYRATHVAFQLDHATVSKSLDLWLGRGLIVATHPIGRGRTQVELTGPAPRIGRALAGGPATLRDLILPVAPPLEASLGDLAHPLDAEVSTPATGRAREWVADGRCLVGPAAYHLSPCTFAADTQAILDTAAVATLLSKDTVDREFSTDAVQPYAESRRAGLDVATNLAHDLHRLGIADGGLLAHALSKTLSALADSARARMQFIHAFAGLDDQPPSVPDRLRLAGIRR